MIIPAELVGARGRERMEAFTNIEKKSLLKWQVNFPKVSKPTIKSI